MSKHKFTCTKCKQSFEVGQDLLGQQVQCPTCQSIVQLPTRRKLDLMGKQKTNQTPLIIVGLVLACVIGWVIFGFVRQNVAVLTGITTVLQERVQSDANAGNVLGAQYKRNLLTILTIEESVMKSSGRERSDKIDELRRALRSTPNYDNDLREALFPKQHLHANLVRMRIKAGYHDIFR